MTAPASMGWTRKDVWNGVLFLAVGILITTYTVLAMRNDAPIVLWGLGWVVGPIFILLGGNGVFRSLTSRRG